MSKDRADDREDEPGASSGARDRTAEYFQRYASRVCLRVVRLGGSADDAQDVMQETFLRLYAALDARERIRDVESWLYTVARRLVIDQGRRKGYDEQKGEAYRHAAQLMSVPDPEDVLIRKRRDAALRDGIHALSDLERRCLRDRARGLKLDEIGAREGMDARRVSEVIAGVVRKLQGHCDE
jgi:RNA polymerase sigma-70 factor (ECF subfamily)